MDQTFDHCVRDYFETHTVYGRGHDGVLGFNEDVYRDDLGTGIESFLARRNKNKPVDKSWRVVHGTM